MSERPSVTCPRCGRTSQHPTDIADRYCGHCHKRHPGLEPTEAWSTLRTRAHGFLGRLGGPCPICDQPEEHQLHAGMPGCDFCNHPKIAWRYPTRRVVAAPARPGQVPSLDVAVHFGEAWLACQPCHELIEARLVWLLARRSADQEVADQRLVLEPEEVYALTLQIRSLHAVFFASCLGPAVGI